MPTDADCERGILRKSKGAGSGACVLELQRVYHEACVVLTAVDLCDLCVRAALALFPFVSRQYTTLRTRWADDGK